MAEGMPIKQTIGSLTKEEGGRCYSCHDLADVTIYATDKGRIMFCNECDEADDKQRYGR